MKTMPKYLIFSGEGDRGTWDPYTGTDSERALKSRLTKERAGGDRWASIWRKTDMEDRRTGWPVYEQFDPDTGEVLDNRSIEPDEELLVDMAAATLGRKGGSAKTEAKQAASRENGKKGGRPKRGRKQ